jgi:Tfp pilus assembly protein PilZ
MSASIITDLGPQAARTRDLSRGGICFILPTPLKVGIRFTVELTLVFDENTFSEPLALAGKVVWCTPVDEGYQIGASFFTLDEETQEYLKMFLNFLSNGVDDEAEEEEVLEEKH